MTSKKSAKAKPAKEAGFFALMERRRVERERDGVREHRAHHAVLGPGWLSLAPKAGAFVADSGQRIELAAWKRLAVGRVSLLFNERRKLTVEDCDYESFLMRDDTTHEFRLEFVGKAEPEATVDIESSPKDERQLSLRI